MSHVSTASGSALGLGSVEAAGSVSASIEGTTTIVTKSTPSPCVMTPKKRNCVICRRRKVRCDNLSPCTTCRRAQVDCVVPSTKPPLG